MGLEQLPDQGEILTNNICTLKGSLEGGFGSGKGQNLESPLPPSAESSELLVPGSNHDMKTHPHAEVRSIRGTATVLQRAPYYLRLPFRAHECTLVPYVARRGNYESRARLYPSQGNSARHLTWSK